MSNAPQTKLRTYLIYKPTGTDHEPVLEPAASATAGSPRAALRLHAEKLEPGEYIVISASALHRLDFRREVSNRVRAL